MSKFIALDCDGVLLNYNEAYKKLWFDAFNGEVLEVADPNAYWAEDMYRARHLQGAEYEHWSRIKEKANFWGNMQPLPGAVEAVERIKDSGYQVIVVTAMNPKFIGSRTKNLQDLGFKIDGIWAVKRVGDENPKAPFINALQPSYFVDDYHEYLKEISLNVNTVLIEPGKNGSPNLDADPQDFNQIFPSLLTFVEEGLEVYK